MTILEQIISKKNIIQLKGFKVMYIVLNPKTERDVFINNELPKNLDLGEYLGIDVILSKEVKEEVIILGI